MQPLKNLSAAFVLILAATVTAAAAEKALPPPAADEPASGGRSEIAVLAGGCFWGVQGVFQHVKGVTNAVSGYAGGAAQTAQYETVSGGDTGHAESVQVTFDPKQITYGQILQVFFSVAHDPTELNRQGRYDRLTDTFFKLTGKAPTNMRDFVKLHAAEFKTGPGLSSAVPEKP